jgi:hypothetical protein
MEPLKPFSFLTDSLVHTATRQPGPRITKFKRLIVVLRQAGSLEAGAACGFPLQREMWRSGRVGRGPEGIGAGSTFVHSWRVGATAPPCSLEGQHFSRSVRCVERVLRRREANESSLVQAAHFSLSCVQPLDGCHGVRYTLAVEAFRRAQDTPTHVHPLSAFSVGIQDAGQG